MHVNRVVHRGFGQLCVILSAIIALSFDGLASASDHIFVMPNGQKVRMVQSEDELGIVFRTTDKDGIAAAARRFASSGRGVVENVRGAEDARVKILRVADTHIQRRNQVRQDPEIESIHRVYRFEGVDTPVISSGTIVVKLHGGETEAEVAALWAAYGLELVEPIEGLHNVYCVKPINAEMNDILLAATLAEDARTKWSQPNLRRPTVTRQSVPDDEFFSSQWHLENTGQFGGTAGADISAREAWLLAEGQDILIGMFDDACDVDHEDLRAGYSGTGQDIALQSNQAGASDPRPKQIGDRHGTSVMGLAVARANDVGVRGVAYLSRFTVSRGLNALVTDAAMAGVYTFARQQGVAVHINSWGIPGQPNPAIIEDAIATAFLEGRDLDGEGQAPPLGMVIVFATGNDGILNRAGFELSTLPQVIGIGASDDTDTRSGFSNFGPETNMLAPSNADFRQPIATTDNTDGAGGVDSGYNVGGFDTNFGLPDLDADGLYTATFGGTSAACPIAGGVAALVLSANPFLTASNVRIILEHTCDPVSPNDAQYHTITSRSEKYGYGRINAARAVEAALQAAGNGGFTWPERPSNFEVEPPLLSWRQNIGSNEFLVLESDSEFSFIPVDGVCYDSDQLGCGSQSITSLPNGVSVIKTGCDGDCVTREVQSAGFVLPAGKKYFAVYARNSIGRYSFGVAVDSDGEIIDPGPSLGAITGGEVPVGPGVDPVSPPSLTINASTTQGESPLTVSFQGNASSTAAIDDSRTAWDFDVSDTILVDAITRNASHTYTLPDGETSRTFTARLTMYDVDGRVGIASVNISVTGSASSGSGGIIGSSNVGIVARVPGSVDSDVSEGTSPFQVELRIDSSTLSGTLQSVVWDLGDGATATSLTVPHTYVNTTSRPLNISVSARVTTLTSGGVTITSDATRRLTVLPGTNIAPPTGNELIGTDPSAGLPGDPGAGTPCGAMGLLPLLCMIVGLVPMRHRYRREH